MKDPEPHIQGTDLAKLAIMLSAVATIFSAIAAFNLNSLNERQAAARLVVDDLGISEIAQTIDGPSKQDCPTDGVCEFIRPTLKNIGATKAQNVHFQILTCPTANVTFTPITHCISLFNETLIGEVQSGASFQFGEGRLSLRIGNVSIVGMAEVIAIHLEYSDPSTAKKQEVSYFIMRTVGDKFSGYLLQSDLDRIKQLYNLAEDLHAAGAPDALVRALGYKQSEAQPLCINPTPGTTCFGQLPISDATTSTH